jgi:hypothetical protein
MRAHNGLDFRKSLRTRLFFPASALLLALALMAPAAAQAGRSSMDDDPINERCERGFSLENKTTKTCPNRRGGTPYQVERACCKNNKHGFVRCKPYPTCNPNSRS